MVIPIKGPFSQPWQVKENNCVLKVGSKAKLPSKPPERQGVNRGVGLSVAYKRDINISKRIMNHV